MADFSVDVSAWCDREERMATAVLRAIAYDTIAAVQQRTPVDTGFLRANWTAMLAHDTEPVAGRVPPPADAIERAEIGTVITIVNPVVYARRIEYGFVGEDSAGRHYNQEGQHMVGDTIAEIGVIAQRALERITGSGGA